MTTAHTDAGAAMKKAKRTYVALILGFIALAAGIIAYSNAATTKVNEAISPGNSGDAVVSNMPSGAPASPVSPINSATPTNDIAADAIPGENDPYAAIPRKTADRVVPNVYDSYSDSSAKRPSSAEVAAVATERGVLLHQWELGFIEQRDKMMKSYGVYDYGEYPDNNWLAWPVPTAGMTILMNNEETGKSRKCTLSGFVRKGGTVYGVTAGHCVLGGFDTVYYKLANEPNVRPLGQVERWQSMGKPGPNELYPFATDVAFILLYQDVAAALDARIATELTVVDMLSPDEITPGMRVCKLGYRSQESCGPVVASNDSEVRVHLFSLGGDSGSVLYTYTDESKHEVAVIGVLSSSPKTGGQTHDFLTDFALLSPLMDYEGMQYIG